MSSCCTSSARLGRYRCGRICADPALAERAPQRPAGEGADAWPLLRAAPALRSHLAKAQRPSQFSAHPHGASARALIGASGPAAQGHQVRQQPRVQTLNAQRRSPMPGESAAAVS